MRFVPGRALLMRDLLLLGVVLGALPFALRHTWVGVLLWTWISVMNPHRLSYGFAHDAPWAAIIAATTLLSLLITRDKLTLRWDPPVKVLLVFLLWMCLTTAFSFFPSLSADQLAKVLKIQLMTFIAFAALQERKHIELFIWVNVISMGFYGLKGGLFTLKGGGSARVMGPPGGFIEGNNELAVALVMAIPLMNYLRMVAIQWYIRLALLLLMVLSAVAALGTQSRGALLAVTAMGLVMWLRSDRKVLTGVWVFGLAVALLAFMPSTWQTRMNTIETYQQDSSAMGRIEAWKMTINLAGRNFFGGGFEIYRPDIYAIFAPESPYLQGAHSIYFSVLGEHGYIGLILFLSIWFLAFRTAGQIRTMARGQEETLWLYQLAGMCQVSLVGYLVGGAFLALAYFDLPYNILIILVVALHCLKDRRGLSQPTARLNGVTLPSQRLLKPQRWAAR
jgi:putative inorganic carbon (hco3(-)) transporter